MAANKQEIGRLAMRVEGDNWSAYYALTDSMDKAIFLGSIRMGAVVNKPERKQAFLLMMRDIVTEILEEATGERATWGEAHAAPEHERAGRG